jgi:hypothetical protein
VFGIPPTGKQTTMSGIAVHRIANGKIMEHWSDLDNLGMLQQLVFTEMLERCLFSETYIQDPVWIVSLPGEAIVTLLLENVSS